MSLYTRVVLGALCVASAAAQQTRIIGVTRAGFQNNAFLVEIDATTGAAALLQPFSVARGADTGPVAWHDPSVSLLMLWRNANGDGGHLAQMAPGSGATSSVTITGLPAGQTGLGGLAYDAQRDRILITFGATASGQPDRVAEIDLLGVVQQTTGPLGIGARDALSVQDSTGDVLLCDFDGPAQRVVAGRNLFTTPAFTTFADPPADATIFDVAADPLQAPVFVVENTGFTLRQVTGSSYTLVGSLGILDDIAGIEAVTCQIDLGFGNAQLRLTACGGTLASGSPAAMTVYPLPPGAPCGLLFGANGLPLPLPPPWSGMLATNPVLFTLPIVPQGPGFFALPLPGGGGPFALVVQGACADPMTQQIVLSNALLITVFP